MPLGRWAVMRMVFWNGILKLWNQAPSLAPLLNHLVPHGACGSSKPTPDIMDGVNSMDGSLSPSM